MTNANTPSGDEALTDSTPAADAVPGTHGTESGKTADDAGQNPPLPDWGPTDGEHGVDGDPES